MSPLTRVDASTASRPSAPRRRGAGRGSRKGAVVPPSAEHLGQRAPRPPSRSVGMDELGVRAREPLRLGEAQQLEPRRVGPQRVALGARSRTAGRARARRAAVRDRCPGGCSSSPPRPRVAPTRPLRYTPGSRQRTAHAERQQASDKRPGSSMGPPTAEYCWPSKEVIRLASANSRAVAWRLTCLRSFRQQRAGCSRELYRGGPGHRPRCAGGARRVPVASPARPAHGLSGRGARSHRRLPAPRAGALPRTDRGRAADRERAALDAPSARATSRRR